MNRYEYAGEDVMAIGVNSDGEHFVETGDGTFIVGGHTKLEGGVMMISVEEVCAKYDIFNPGQVVYGPRRSE